MIIEDSDLSFLADDSASDFSFEDENVAPKSKAKAGKGNRKATGKAKGKGKAKAKGAALTSSSSANANAADSASAPTAGPSKKKTIEERYQKKTQLEHILLRPDTYIGSTERVTQRMIVLGSGSHSDSDSDSVSDPSPDSNSAPAPAPARLVEREVTFTPGLYKIFDEILVNAADNKQRDPDGMDRMDIVVDAPNNTISVRNNGAGIPVEMHREHGCYVPTLIFGHLLTGSNFDDNEKKTTGGRNGYGAKLANIFSKEFVVECLDSSRGVRFRQVFRDNMGRAEEPTVTKATKAEIKAGDYTKITFCPDLERFKMTSLDDDTVSLLSKRAYDIAGSMSGRGGKRLAVYLNGNKLPVKDFKSYLGMIDGIEAVVAFEVDKDGGRWEVGVAPSSNGSFEQISFVNAICTSKGGGHVTYIADQIADRLKAVVKKKNKGGVEIKPNQIKNHLRVFVNALVDNPAFDSQTKEGLTTTKKAFGSTFTLSPKFIKAVEKSAVVENILAFAKFKERQGLKRQGGTKKTKLTGITKLDDANFAGGAKSKDCTLLLTEGDSAKSLAMSGLSVVGRDYYGVFPLKGKLLNARDASLSQISKNEEIKNIIDILGLKFNVEYDETNIKTLRYGSLMIMADQDHDGSHIKGLVINFIHKFWPSLLNVPGFLLQFITPIVKATKGKKSKTFFTLPEYEAWKESTGNEGKGYKVKYYKGLGTSTSAEAKEYFGNLGVHQIRFNMLDSDLGEKAVAIDHEDDDMMEFDNDPARPPVLAATSGNELIDMAFNKAKVEDRKVWLGCLEKKTYLNYSRAQKEGVCFSDFINKELILFSNADNQRSIPHVMDGFKPSQRKIIFSCFKRKLKGEIKVAQLAGYVGEHSAYHHGEASLQGAIVGMAQSFCGSNNINLLTPSGQFGTRRMGGKDAASPRYIFTKLEKITRAIFHPDDDALMDYLNDDGLSIEPEFYMPVIPMVLVNGSDGIGTGWSSSTPNFNPREIVENLRRMIRGEEPAKMAPYYGGFKGEIVPEIGKREGSYIIKGRIERLDDTTLKITELPIKKWTQDYKRFLEIMMVGEEKATKGKKDTKKDAKEAKVEIKDFKENHTDSTVSFTVIATKEKIDEFEQDKKGGLYGKFKLTTTVSTSNMHLFDTHGRIIKYNSPEEILEEFYNLRLSFYEKRKEHLLKILRKDRLTLSNKARFVEEVCSGDLVVSNRKKSEILADLQKRGYDLMTKDKDKDGHQDGDDDDNELDESASDADLVKGYEYLLGMKIWSLTYEKAEKLRAELAEKTQEVVELEETPTSTIWWNDLDVINDLLDERDAEIKAAEMAERKEQAKARKKNSKKKAKGSKKKKKVDEWDSDESDEDDNGDISDSDNSNFEGKQVSIARQKRAPPPSAAAKPRKVIAKKAFVPIAKTEPKPKKSVEQPVKQPVKQPEPVREEDSDSDSDVSIDLAARLASRMTKMIVSPPTKATKTMKQKMSKQKMIVSVMDSDDELENDRKRPSPKESEVEVRDESPGKTTRPKAAKKAKRAPAKKAPAKKAPTRKAVVKKKKTVLEDLSESEQSFVDLDSDDDSIARDDSPVVPRAGRSRRTTAKKTYTFDDDDSEEEFADSEEEDFDFNE